MSNRNLLGQGLFPKCYCATMGSRTNKIHLSAVLQFTILYNKPSNMGVVHSLVFCYNAGGGVATNNFCPPLKSVCRPKIKNNRRNKRNNMLLF